MKETQSSNLRFKISLAQWSLHKALFARELDHLDFAKRAASLDIFGVEYVSRFFKDKAADKSYLAEMNQRAEDNNVTQLLIMIDGEGGLAELDINMRNTAVDNHRKWVGAAHTLGCHSIRVNAYGNSEDRLALHEAAVHGLSHLSIYAQSAGINVLVENHGGLSSDGQWLRGVIEEVDLCNCGTLPDFGNFCIRQTPATNTVAKCELEYDRYRGIEEMIPYAKALSAKSYNFDDGGNETTIDYERMMNVVKNSAYAGYIGIEYEGTRLTEDEGIKATKRLIEKHIF